MKKMILKVLGIAIIVIIIAVVMIAKSKGVSPLSWKMHHPISQSQQIAIGGFDPVNYFNNKSAEKGDSNFSYLWKNVNWYFVSQDHLDKFKANPSQFEPQFGGWCSFAISKGFTATPDPKAWLTRDDRLYLFADQAMKKQWEDQLPDVLEKCKKKWTN